MASIMADRQQEEALAQVNRDIDQIRLVNALIDNTQLFTVGNGTKKSSVQLDVSLSDKVIQILKRQKELYSKEIQRLTQKFRIQLDEDDMKEIEGTCDSVGSPPDHDPYGEESL